MSSPSKLSLYSDLDYLGAASDYVDDVFDAISDSALFGHFIRNEIEALCQFMHCYAAPRGTTLLNEGDEGDFLLVILSGGVDVVKRLDEGRLVSVATAAAGVSLGEMSLVDGEKRFASCVTTQPTDFAVLSRTDLHDILVAHPRLANKLLIRIMEVLVRRLRSTGNRLLTGYINNSM